MSDNNFFEGNNNVCPVGTIVYWAGKTSLKETLTSFLPADGRSLEQADYPLFFSTLGTRYGTGAGSTTFQLPDPTGTTSKLLIAGAATDAGSTVASTRTAFATATFSIKDQSYLPPFTMDYDTTAPYAGTNNYYRDDSGNENLYTKSNVTSRDPNGGNKYVREDSNYTNDGGIGLQATNPQITFYSGSDPDPIDITADITAPASFIPPTFEIMALIKVKN